MGLYPETPLTIGRVLDTGFVMFRRAFKTVLPLSAIAALIGQVPALAQAGLQSELAAGNFGVLLWALPGWLLWTAVYVVFMNGLLRMLDALGRGEEPPSLGAAIGGGLPRVLPAVGTLLLYVIVMTIGFLLLLVPGVILAQSMAFCWYLVVLDGRGPVEALGESHRLVWGKWWRTAAVTTVALIVYAVPGMIVGLIAGVVFAVTAGVNGPDSVESAVLALTLPMAALQAVASALLLPMLLSMLLVQLRELQLRQSGSDLAARAEAA